MLGYLLGSISPAYFLGQLVRGIDIRKYGTKNAGASNAWKVLGKSYGISVALFDIVKGFLPVFIASLLGFSWYLLVLVYFATILGHCFPFYLNFKAGVGQAVTLGALLAFILEFWFSFEVLIITIACLATINFALGFAALDLRSDERLVKLRKKNKGKIIIWRKTLRFLALIFPILYIFYQKVVVLYFIAVILAVFVIIDLLRTLSQKTDKNTILSRLFKTKEKKVSGIVLFLISALITVMFFEKNIAILTLVFFTIGDNVAVFVGSFYGLRSFKARSLEGSFAFLASCFFAGLLLLKLGFVNLPFTIMFAGAFTATLVEALSTKIDDNITVAILTAIVMTILHNL